MARPRAPRGRVRTLERRPDRLREARRAHRQPLLPSPTACAPTLGHSCRMAPIVSGLPRERDGRTTSRASPTRSTSSPSAPLMGRCNISNLKKCWARFMRRGSSPPAASSATRVRSGHPRRRALLLILMTPSGPHAPEDVRDLRCDPRPTPRGCNATRIQGLGDLSAGISAIQQMCAAVPGSASAWRSVRYSLRVLTGQSSSHGEAPAQSGSPPGTCRPRTALSGPAAR